MNKFCFIKYSCVLLCAFFNLSLTAQTNSFRSYETNTNTLIGKFQNALIQKELWRPFERQVEDLIKDMDDGLAKGSGLSFTEMNTVRSYQSGLQSIIEFGDGIANGGFQQMFNGRMLKKIMEYFPNITFDFVNGNNCVRFYKITVNNYTVIVARHNEKGKLRNIYWSDPNRSNKTFGGSFTLMPGIYRQVWNNSENLQYNGSGIKIDECDFKAYWDDENSPVKPFVDH